MIPVKWENICVFFSLNQTPFKVIEKIQLIKATTFLNAEKIGLKWPTVTLWYFWHVFLVERTSYDEKI